MYDTITPQRFIIMMRRKDYDALYEGIYEFALDWIDEYGNHKIIDSGDTVVVVPEHDLGADFRSMHFARSGQRAVFAEPVEGGGE